MVVVTKQTRKVEEKNDDKIQVKFLGEQKTNGLELNKNRKSD